MPAPRGHRPPTAAPLFFLTTLAVLSFFVAGTPDTLLPGQPLRANQTLVSPGGDFELAFFSLAGAAANYYLGVRYRNGGDPADAKNIVWIANRERPIAGDHLAGVTLSLTNGSLSLTHPAAGVIWSSNFTATANPAGAELLYNGNFVVKDSGAASPAVVWESFGSPGDKLLPGGYLLNDPSSGGVVKLTSWRRADDPAVGDTELNKDPTANQIFIITTPDGAGADVNVPQFLVMHVDDNGRLIFDRSDEPAKYEYLLLTSGMVALWRRETNTTDWHTTWNSTVTPSSCCSPSPAAAVTTAIDKLLIVLPVIGLLLAGIALSCCLKKSTARREEAANGFLTAYSYAQLRKATRGFSTKLGEGGFGTVYRGELQFSSPATAVAVKDLKGVVHDGQQSEKQFRAEVQTLGVIQHANLVRLVGFCGEGRRRLLVYEFIPNGSLDKHLFLSGEPLSWRRRFGIALGVARALAYLHEACSPRIIHCDVKPANVLLDDAYGVKLSDFGMAKLLHRDFSRALTTVRGTVGYLAPEWITGEAITPAVDVYSYGMMLLEIVSGRRNMDNAERGGYGCYPIHAVEQTAAGEERCLVDRRLDGEEAVDWRELRAVCRVACWCIQCDERRRPTMGKVVQMLQGNVDVEIPPVPTSLWFVLDVEEESTESELSREFWDGGGGEEMKTVA